MHNEVLHTLEYGQLPTSAFFSYFSHLSDVAPSSLQTIQVIFYSKLEEVLDNKYQTQWNEVDNVLCGSKFKQLESFKIDSRYINGITQSQAQVTLKKLLPKCYNKKILWFKCAYKCEQISFS